MSERTSYVSCGCNRAPHCADWGKNGLICYAACHAIVIYEPSVSALQIGIGRVTETLYQHADRVNTVRWIERRNGEAESELLSCSVDGTAIIWSKINNRFESSTVMSIGSVLTVGNASYICNNSYKKEFSRLLVCTGSIDGDLKLWLRDASADAKSLETISLGTKLPLEACFSYVSDTDLLLLAVAIEDSSIELYATKSLALEESGFRKVQVLLGHEDWVRSLDFSSEYYNSEGSLLLASGSQDAMIRLWRISEDKVESSKEELSQKKQVFQIDDTGYKVTLESVLYGHEGWIYGVHWYAAPHRRKEPQADDTTLSPCLKLLSCSLDKSMIIWEPDQSTGIWSEKVRVGEVGGNSLGFYGCKFNGDGSSILAHGYQGSFHIWKYTEATKNWLPAPVPSGHFAEVVDLCWDPKGRFLVTASIDQTTRIHAPWSDGRTEFWHEMGRPQVHGYDLACLVVLTPCVFASGAEEKVVRIFTSPLAFKNKLIKISSDVDDFRSTSADGATVPALGLTNKATFDEKINQTEETKLEEFKNEDYVPPTEEELMQNTLWPELQKLYGHGYEIFSMSSRHDGSLLATACKSSSAEHSAILLWSTKTWAQLDKLVSHQLTVTQMEFSPNDRYLVSVSRDRRWSLFECRDGRYILKVASSKKDGLHSRIIWCCAWTPDSSFFATGSRDGKIGLWSPDFQDNKIVPEVSLEDNKDSVTALSFAPRSTGENSYLLAIGYETGYIEIRKIARSADHFACLIQPTFVSFKAHHSTVRRLKFRPNGEHSKGLQLASCGSDHTVKIHDLNISM